MAQNLVELMAGLVRPGWRWDFWAAALTHDELGLFVRPDRLVALNITDDQGLQAALCDWEIRAITGRDGGLPPSPG